MNPNESRVRQTEGFSLFDKSGSGKIARKNVANVMRTLGRNPSERDIQMILTELDPNNEGSVHLETFLKYMAENIPDEDPTEELFEAFKVFDKSNVGYISMHELRNILTNYGDKLSESELDEFLEVADENKTGFLKYAAFAKVMTLH